MILFRARVGLDSHRPSLRCTPLTPGMSSWELDRKSDCPVCADRGDIV